MYGKWNKDEALIARAIAAIEKSISFGEVLDKLGLKPTGRNYVELQRLCSRLGLDTGHFLGKAHLRGKTHNWAVRRSLSEILVANSTYNSGGSLKRRLIKEGLLANRCAQCSSPPEWQGRPLVLQLDHVNGISDDNRIENLRLLCPNCHSQTSTYCGKNKGRNSSPLRDSNPTIGPSEGPC